MKKQWYFILAVGALLLGFVYYQARPLPPKKVTLTRATSQVELKLEACRNSNPYLQKLLLAYSKYVNDAVEKNQTPGAAVAIVRDTSIIYLKGFGLRAIDDSDSVDVNTVFRLGSVSKSFAAILAGRLVDDHLISWDDPVNKYLNDFQLKSKESTENLKLRHVLSHTIGLPYHAYTSMIEDGTNLDTMIHHLKDLDLIAQPGKMYSYQNVGYSLIGKVMESATGHSFERLLQEQIFHPLKMDHASASYNEILKVENRAKPHLFSKNGWQTIPISKHYYNVSPAGGVNASISDMALLLKALLNQKDFLQTTTLDEIFTPQVKATSRNRNFGMWHRPHASYYGLGWRIIHFGSDTLLYHGGYVNGYRSEVAIHRSKKLAISVLTNGSGNLADQSIPQFYKLYEAYADSIQMWERNYKSAQAKK